MNPELTKEKVLSNLQDFGYKTPNSSQVGGAFTRDGIISQDGTTPITAESLTPETPIVTPTAPVLTGALGVSTQAEQYAKSSKANADAEQQRLDKQQETLQSSEQSIADIITGMGEAGNKKQQAYEDQGLIDIKKNSDSIRTAMESANLATRRRIEELQKNNPEGQSASALNAQIRDIEAKNASYQADQAIVLSALNRDFETAKSFIDAKVDAETEQQKATLDARTFLYEQNKDRFTKAEQRKIEADLRDEDRAYQEEKQTKKTLEETKIEAMKNAKEQGAPSSIIQAISKSKTVEEAIVNAGEYGGDIKRKLEIQKMMQTSASERKATAEALKNAQTSVPILQDKLTLVDTIKTLPGLSIRVGPTAIGRSGGFLGLGTSIKEATGAGQSFAGAVHNLVSGLTLDNLIQAKARGATFGALSEGELSILAASATKINDWEIKDDKGRGTGVWNIDEKSFKQELDNIKNLTNRSLMLSEGTLLSNEEQSSLDSSFDNLPVDPTNYFQ